MEDLQGAYLRKKQHNLLWHILITLTWYVRYSSKNNVITRVILMLAGDGGGGGRPLPGREMSTYNFYL